jgi:hypothetical protein
LKFYAKTQRKERKLRAIGRRGKSVRKTSKISSKCSLEN